MIVSGLSRGQRGFLRFRGFKPSQEKNFDFLGVWEPKGSGFSRVEGGKIFRAADELEARKHPGEKPAMQRTIALRETCPLPSEFKTIGQSGGFQVSVDGSPDFGE